MNLTEFIKKLPSGTNLNINKISNERILISLENKKINRRVASSADTDIHHLRNDLNDLLNMMRPSLS